MYMANNPATPYILRISKRYCCPETEFTLSRDSFVCGLFYREEGINKDENIWKHSAVLPASVAVVVLLLVIGMFCLKKRKFLMIAAKERYPTYRFLDIAALLH
jgi:hypothetical protein